MLKLPLRPLGLIALVGVLAASSAFGNGQPKIPTGEVAPPTLVPGLGSMGGGTPAVTPAESGSSISSLESSLVLPDTPDVLQAPPEALQHQPTETSLGTFQTESPPTATVQDKKAESEWVQAAQDLGSELGAHQEALARPDLTAPQAHSTGRKVEGLMAGVLHALAEAPPGTELELDFVPTPKDLREIAEMSRFPPPRHATEVFLYRTRRGPWKIQKGQDMHEVEGEFEGYDIAMHNHLDLRWGIYSTYSPYPAPGDLIASAGKAARFFVISLDGIVEWSPRIPFPDDPGRLLPANSSEDESGEWIRRMTDGTRFRRIVMRVLFPQYLYPTLLKSIGIAAAHRPWKKVTQEWLSRGTAPVTEDHLVGEILPSIFQEELERSVPKMAGRAPTSAERDKALGETSVKRLRWYHRFMDGVPTDPSGATALAGVPDGITYPDGTIRLNLKTGWRRYVSVENHFRVLYTHEYAHRLQVEGALSRAYGAEIPAVAFEVLRAIELLGLERMASGEISFLHEGVVRMFEAGRRWARGGARRAERSEPEDVRPAERGARKGSDGFYHKGFLAGAAYELYAQTGRWEDAWEYVRRVSSPAPEPPTQASPHKPMEETAPARGLLNRLFKNTSEMWREYQSRYLEAERRHRPAVDDAEGFFSEIYGIGRIWWLPGSYFGTRLSLQATLRTARRALRRRFLPKAPEAGAAFEGFLARVMETNEKDYPNRARKTIRNALREASLLPPGQVAAYWEGLLNPESLRRIQDFRENKQRRILESFIEGTRRLLAERSAGAAPLRGTDVLGLAPLRPPGAGTEEPYNAVGVVLTGSYAYGTATPASDLDLVVLTRDGTSRHVEDFMERLERLGETHDWPSWKDWKLFRNVFPVSPKVMARYYRELPYRIISPHPDVVNTLGAEVVWRPFWLPTARQEALIPFFEPMQRAFVRFVIRAERFRTKVPNGPG